MKKTFPVNINGKIFYIDEDAYKLLLDYLSQLRTTFTGAEGEEIVNDIESRISEHFDERIRLGANVIVLEDVNRVIETMGRPEELSDDSRPASSGTDESEDGCDSQNVPPFNGTRSCPPPPVHKRLFRDIRHRVFGGVIAGLSQYFDWDVTVMRILFVVLTLCTYFWPCVIIYLVAWMVIPVARTPREILEMQGQPVTLDNIGQTVINNSVPPAAPVPDTDTSSFAYFVNTFFSIAAKFILGFFGLIAAVTAIVFCCLILVAICGIIVYWTSGATTILDGLDILETAAPYFSSWGGVAIFCAILLPALAVTWVASCVLFKAKTPSKAGIITAVILEIIIIAVAVVLSGLADHYEDQAFSTFYSMAEPISFSLTSSIESLSQVAETASAIPSLTRHAVIPSAVLIAPAMAA